MFFAPSLEYPRVTLVIVQNSAFQRHLSNNDRCAGVLSSPLLHRWRELGALSTGTVLSVCADGVIGYWMEMWILTVGIHPW